MFTLNRQFRAKRQAPWVSILTGIIVTLALSLPTAAIAQHGREVFVQTVGELYAAVNNGVQNDVIVLAPETFVLDSGPLRLKRGMVLQGSSRDETVVDGTNLILEFPFDEEDSVEGVIEISPGNRLRNFTVQGARLGLMDGGSAVVLIRPINQGPKDQRAVIQNVIIDGGAQGLLAIHRLDDDDSALSVAHIERSTVKNALFNGIILLFWQGVSNSRFHLTVEKCTLTGSRFGLGVFTSGVDVFAGVGDNNNDVTILSLNNHYKDNTDFGTLFLPRLGANDNRFRFISVNDEFAGNGNAVVAFGAGFATMSAPSDNNQVILNFLRPRFNTDTITVGGTREPVPDPYPGAGNRVDLLLRQGESNLPSEDDFLFIVNSTDSNSVQLIGDHIQVEFGP